MDKKEFANLDGFEKQTQIGFGGFGEVFKVLEKSTGKIYAAKISMIDISEDQKSLVIELRHEVNILAKLNHPSILKFIGYSPINFLGEPKPVIITEYSPNGSLKDILDLEKNSKQPESWNATKKLINIYGIASAMSYLHSHNIIHRDLKTGNILEDDYLFPKLADFGLSKIYHQSESSMSAQSAKDLKGTPKYVAPESWDKYEYTKEGDVYSFSFIVYQILTLEEPFKNFNMQMLYSQVVKKGYRPEFNKPIADCYKELITQCWSEKPEKRPTFEEIVNRLKTDSNFITEEVNKDEYLSYINLIDNYQITYDPSTKFSKITVDSGNENKDQKSKEKVSTVVEDDDEEERFKRALQQANRKQPVKDSSSSSSDDSSSQSKNAISEIFNEVSHMKEFGNLPEETRDFLKQSLAKNKSTNIKAITIPNNKTILLFANESFTSPDFIAILKHFDKITIEIKYPSNVFEQMLNSISNLNNEKVTTIKIHIICSQIAELKTLIQNTPYPIVISFESSKITEIDECAFERCVSMTEITIPYSVTSIGKYAFSGCSKLTHVTIPSSVVSIGSYAFSGCSNLPQITIPFSVKEIGDGSFSFCSKLAQFTFPSSIKKINDHLFKNCSSLSQVVFNAPVSIVSIGVESFKNCSKLAQITIPPSVTEIYQSAFEGCSSLAQVTIPSSVIHICSSCFLMCTKIEKVAFELPSSLVSVGEKAFGECSSLSEFVFPQSVKDIEIKVFEGCTALKKISIPNSIKKLFLSRHLGVDKNVEIIKT